MNNARQLTSATNSGSQLRQTTWGCCRALLGALLLFAIALKAYYGNVDFLPGRQLPAIAFAALIQIEAILGLWLLSGLWGKHAKFFALLLFGLFAALNLSAVFLGAKTCNCFGSFGLSPWVSLVIDSLAIFGLIIADPPATADSFRMSVAGLCGAILAGGTLAYALRTVAVTPETIAVGPSELRIKSAMPGEWYKGQLTVANRSEAEVRIVGAVDSCNYVISDDLPAAIPATSQKSLTIRFLAPASAGKFEYTCRMFTNFEGQFTTSGRLIVRVDSVQSSVIGANAPKKGDVP